MFFEKAPMHVINILTFKSSIFVIVKKQLLFVFENDKKKGLSSVKNVSVTLFPYSSHVAA